MAKTMLFIDGTWLYSNTTKLAEACGNREFRIDFGKLPNLVAREVGKRMGTPDVDVVRTFLFGTYASNYDLRDDEAVQRRLDFLDMLKEEHHYELEVYPINFRGRRLRRADRDISDNFEPKEKCVDISLATAMLYYAAIPSAYDIAVAVVGDQDFKPVLQYARRLGKRVAIASIKGSCTPEFADPRDEARVKNFDIIWLNDLLAELELKYEPHQMECASPKHRGVRSVWTTFHPRKGQKYYYDECRTEFAKQKQETQQEYPFSSLDLKSLGVSGPCSLGQRLSGVITNKIADRGFGFIKTPDGSDYFLHLTDLQPDLEFEMVQEGFQVTFQLKKEPSNEKAGAAQNVSAYRVLSNGDVDDDLSERAASY